MTDTSESKAVSKAQIIAELRDDIAAYLNEKWSSPLPILWQNMPLPQPLPDDGWVRFSCQLRSVKTIGLSSQDRLCQGVLTITVAIPKDTGMAVSDGITDQLIALFSASSIGTIKLGQMAMDTPRDEHGHHLTPIAIRFSAIVALKN